MGPRTKKDENTPKKGGIGKSSKTSSSSSSSSSNSSSSSKKKKDDEEVITYHRTNQHEINAFFHNIKQASKLKTPQQMQVEFDEETSESEEEEEEEEEVTEVPTATKKKKKRTKKKNINTGTKRRRTAALVNEKGNNPSNEGSGDDISQDGGDNTIVSSSFNKGVVVSSSAQRQQIYLLQESFHKKIQNLDAYFNCKSIWLDSNGLETIEGMESLKELRCLFLSKNLITAIQGLDSLKNLAVLDLSYNRITRIDGLSACLALESLNLSRNALSAADTIEHLTCCPSLHTLDLANNQLYGDDVLLVLSRIPKLKTLSINGNEVTKSASFRKKMITAIPSLVYLDRPVEEIEKIGANAFISGGAEAETLARDSYRDQKLSEKRNEMAEFLTWQEEQKKKIVPVGENSDHVYISEYTSEEMEQRQQDAHMQSTRENSFFRGMRYGGTGPRSVGDGDTDCNEATAVATPADLEPVVRARGEGTVTESEETNVKVLLDRCRLDEETPAVNPPLPPVNIPTNCCSCTKTCDNSENPRDNSVLMSVDAEFHPSTIWCEEV